MQFGLIARTPVAAAIGYALLRFARLFKKSGGLDIPLYFMAPAAFYLNSVYFTQSKN